MSVGEAELAQRLVAALGSGTVEESFGQSSATVDVQQWRRAALLARDELGCVLFDHLLVGDAGKPDACGTEWEVVVHVVRPRGAAGLLLRTRLPFGRPLPSVTEVWSGAAWPEREAAEMAGIDVTGHPDLRPLLLAPGAGLHPLRKDALLVSRAVRPWPGRLEPGEAADGVATTTAGRRRAAAPGVPPAGWGST